jgi:hypothetical protein
MEYQTRHKIKVQWAGGSIKEGISCNAIINKTITYDEAPHPTPPILFLAIGHVPFHSHAMTKLHHFI